MRTAIASTVTVRTLLEWRVLALSLTLFMYAFGYGGLTSFVALYTDQNAVTPRALYFTLFSLDDRRRPAPSSAALRIASAIAASSCLASR